MSPLEALPSAQQNLVASLLSVILAAQVVFLFFSGHGVNINGKQYAVGGDASVVNLYKEFVVEANRQLSNAVIVLCIDACSEAANATVVAATEEASAEGATVSTATPAPSHCASATPTTSNSTTPPEFEGAL